MPGHGILQELVLVYAVAVGLLLLSSRLRVPSIVALIAAGIIAGPSGARLVTTQSNVDLMAEIGVALLLFTAGLELSLTELRRVWRSVLPAGLAQVALTTLAVAALVVLAPGGSGANAALIGLAVALSSTAVVLKELAFHNHLHAPHGRLAMGVLLLQDLVVIAVLALSPALLGAQAAGSVGAAVGKLLLSAAGVVLIGRVLLPWLLRRASDISKEVFSLAVLLASIGTALLAAMVGLSMAAGAFVAGLVLAEGEFSHQVHADVRPLRDLLSSLFFVSVSMLLDVRQMLPLLPAIVGLALAIVIVKTAVGVAALAAVRVPYRIALASAIALAQVGEFSFVLGREAVNAAVIPAQWWQMLLGSSVLTMAVTPFLIGAAPALSARLRWTDRRSTSDTPHEATPSVRDHVVVLGYGVGGQLLTQSLSDLGVPHVVLELNGAVVRSALAQGVPIRYGDATGAEPLEALGVGAAAAVVVVLSDPDVSERAVRMARTLAPDVTIIARTRYRHEAERLMRVGATLAVAEELEASLEVLAQLLVRLAVPGNVTETIVESYRRLANPDARRPMRAPAVPLAQLPPDLRDVPVASFRLETEAWAVGRTLKEIDLRAATGATVLAIRRKGRAIASPTGSVPLQAGDDIYLLGDESDILLARALLTDGPRATTAKQTPVARG